MLYCRIQVPTKFQQTVKQLFVAAIVAIGCPLFGNAQQIKEFQGLWVFSDEISTVNARQKLVCRSAANGIDALYISIYRPQPNSAGRLMFEDSDVADLVARAHNNKIEVWAAYGDIDWHVLGCERSSFPRQRMDEVVAYNAANPKNKLDGVILDIEPAGSQSVFMPALLSLYECLADSLRANDLRVAAAIRFFWDAPIVSPENGTVKPGYQHVIDLELDNVVVMGYRDYAGNGNDNGIIELDKDEIEYATSVGKTGQVLVGLETGDCSPECGPEIVTFFEEKQKSLIQATTEVSEYFASEPGFGGFAIHRYDAAFLSGTKGWPATADDSCQIRNSPLPFPRR